MGCPTSRGGKAGPAAVGDQFALADWRPEGRRVAHGACVAETAAGSEFVDKRYIEDVVGVTEAVAPPELVATRLQRSARALFRTCRRDDPRGRSAWHRRVGGWPAPESVRCQPSSKTATLPVKDGSKLARSTGSARRGPSRQLP